MPSIFDDNNLLQKLIEAGEKSIQKKAQYWTPSNVPPETLAIYRLAKKLALNLKSNIEPGSVTKEAPVDFSGAQSPDGNIQAPQIKPENLETLGAFLAWAATNGIKWNDRQISFVNKDQASPNAYVFQAYQFDKGNVLRDPYTRQAVTTDYYVDKDALIQFLTYLRDSETAKTNKVFEVMISKVINQANQSLEPNEQIGTRAPEKSMTTFNDGDIIDGFTSTIMDPKNPYDGITQYAPTFASAPMKLTYGDIKDFGSLQAWLNGMTGPDRKNPNDPGGNPCPLINVLYMRAKFLSGRSDYDKNRPKYSDLAKLYAQNVTSFGRQFQFNGQACDVITPEAGTTGAGGTGAGTSGTTPGAGTGGPGDPNVLRHLSMEGPFNSNDINLDRITAWINRYAQYQPDVQSYVSTIERMIAEAKTYSVAPINSIPTSTLNYETFSRITNHPRMLAEHLWSIIYYTGNLYQSFISGHKDNILGLKPNGEELYRAAYQQIAGSSPYADNIRVINELQNEIRAEVAKNTR